MSRRLFLINPRQFGGGTSTGSHSRYRSWRACSPGPPSSVLEKMRNLNGSRPSWRQWDVLAGAQLRDDPARFSRIYRSRAARAEGIGSDRCPIPRARGRGRSWPCWPGRTQPVRRRGGHARRDHAVTAESAWKERRPSRLCSVPSGSDSMCSPGMCSPTVAAGACSADSRRRQRSDGKRMLLAGHIKPWKDSSSVSGSILVTAWPPAPPTMPRSKGHDHCERRAAHPSRPPLAGAVQADPLARQYY